MDFDNSFNKLLYEMYNLVYKMTEFNDIDNGVCVASSSLNFLNQKYSFKLLTFILLKCRIYDSVHFLTVE